MHKYLCIARPPQEARPSSTVKLEGKYEQYEFMDCTRESIWIWGWIETEQPLAFMEMWTYSLRPEDKIELAHYIFWGYANKDPQDQLYFETDFTEAYIADKLRKTDPLYWAASILAEEENAAR